jgi:hypothetical protein
VAGLISLQSHESVKPFIGTAAETALIPLPPGDSHTSRINAFGQVTGGFYAGGPKGHAFVGTIAGIALVASVDFVPASFGHEPNVRAARTSYSETARTGSSMTMYPRPVTSG